MWTLIARPTRTDAATLVSPWHPGMVAAFLAIGVYGGLIQAGVGFAILAATRMAGMDLVKGNAVKVLTVMLLTVLSLAIFAVGGVVRWGPGLALGAGNALGAHGRRPPGRDPRPRLDPAGGHGSGRRDGRPALAGTLASSRLGAVSRDAAGIYTHVTAVGHGPFGML